MRVKLTHLPTLPGSLSCPQLSGMERQSRLPQPEAEEMLGGDQLRRKPGGRRASRPPACSAVQALHEVFGPLPSPVQSHFSVDKCPSSAGTQSTGKSQNSPVAEQTALGSPQGAGWLLPSTLAPGTAFRASFLHMPSRAKPQHCQPA